MASTMAQVPTTKYVPMSSLIILAALQVSIKRLAPELSPLPNTKLSTKESEPFG